MPLNERQIRILRAIEQGNITGDSIAVALGSSMQMLKYYLDTLAEDGYLKAAKVYDNETREFQIVRAYLTEKGKAELDQKDSSIQIGSVHETPKSFINREATANQPTYALSELLQPLEVLSRAIEQLPEERRELATVYFHDLQDEIKIVYRRKPEKIKAYFIAVLGMILPVAKQIENVDRFVESTKILSRKLNVPVKLPSFDRDS